MDVVGWHRGGSVACAALSGAPQDATDPTLACARHDRPPRSALMRRPVVAAPTRVRRVHRGVHTPAPPAVGGSSACRPGDGAFGSTMRATTVGGMSVSAVVAVLAERAGVASVGELTAATSPGAVRAAVRSGVVMRTSRGMYALTAVATAPPAHRSWTDPEPSEAQILHLARARAVARGRCAALSHRAAAAQYGWAVFDPAPHLDLIVPVDRRVRAAPGIRQHRGRIGASERECFRTAPIRTVIDCAVELPFPEALAVADSALRSGRVGPQALRAAADRYRGRHSRRVRRVAEAADPGADNPFESVVRAHLLDVAGFAPTTQHTIADAGFHARVDIADLEHRIVVEADSHRYHGAREAFLRDVSRYTGLVMRNWVVLRFTVADARAGTPIREAAAAALETRRVPGPLEPEGPTSREGRPTATR